MKITAIGTVIHWDNGKMVVLNPGDTGELSDTLAQGEIDAKNASRAGGASSPGDPIAVGNFTMTHKPIGFYVIAGPGLDEPETVRGKAAAESRIAELEAALNDGADDDAGAGDTDGAPID